MIKAPLIVASCSLFMLVGTAVAQDAPPAQPPAGAGPGAMPAAAAYVVPREPAANSLYVELLGNGLLYSLNYDRLITPNVSVRAGLMYISLSATASSGDATASAKATIILVPLLANYLLGPGDHKLEVGAGPLLLYASGKAESADSVAEGSGAAIAMTAVAGYRYAPAAGGFVFRAGFTPVLGQGGFQPWFGISFGVAF